MNNKENSRLKKYLEDEFGISNKIIELVKKAEEELSEDFFLVEERASYHQARVLKAFQDCNISDMHFGWNTGYGYDDPGREAVESVFAKVFGGESALVRPNIVNGTHAISLALLGLLRAGDKVIYCTGTPYDTLQSVIGYKESEDKGRLGGDNFNGTLNDQGILYEEIPLLNNDDIDLNRLKASLDDSVAMVAIQRSKGYSWRNSITVNQIKHVAELVHSYNPHIIIMVDNCYCEFVEEDEPLSMGADIICGSLIKNPGGGLALTGGYLSGKENLINKTAYRLTCPGIGAECGLTFGQNRRILQGLFQAPRVTGDAFKGALLCGRVFDGLGFDTCPKAAFDYEDCRSDIIQAVKLGSPEAVMAFCKGIQSAAPVDSQVTPVPAPMPGYEDDIIMAAGTFIQGASIELSADGPLREPYIVYYQGGLTYDHAKIGIMMAVKNLAENGLIKL